MQKRITAWRQMMQASGLSALAPASVLFRLLVLVVLGGRLVQAGWGLPYVGEIDEKPILDAVRSILRTGDMNPHFFSYGSLPVYLSLGAAAVGFLSAASSGVVATLDEFTHVSHEGLVLAAAGFLGWPRLLFALLNTVTLIPVYLTAKRLYGQWAGAAAALVLASSYLAAYYAIRVNVDGLAALWAAWCAWAALRVLDAKQPWRWLWISGVGAGLAVGSKYLQGLVLLMPLAALALRDHRQRGGWERNMGLGMALLGLSTGLTFLLTTPYALLALPEFLGAVGGSAAHYGAVGHTGFEGEPGWPQLLFHLRFIGSNQGLGLLAAILACIGILVVIGQRAQRRAGLVLLSFVVVELLFFAQQRANFVRNLLPIYPVLAVFAGAAVAWAAAWLARLLAVKLGTRRAAATAFLLSALVLLLGLEVRGVIAFARAHHDYQPTQAQVMAWLHLHTQPTGQVAIPLEIPWSAASLAHAQFIVKPYAARMPDLDALAAAGVRWVVAPTFADTGSTLLPPGWMLAGLESVAVFGALPFAPGRALDLQLAIAPLPPERPTGGVAPVDLAAFSPAGGWSPTQISAWRSQLDIAQGLPLYWNGELAGVEMPVVLPAQLVIEGYGTPGGPPDAYRPPRLRIAAQCAAGQSAERVIWLGSTTTQFLGPLVQPTPRDAGAAVGAAVGQNQAVTSTCRVRLFFDDDAGSLTGRQPNDRNVVVQSLVWAPIAYDFSAQLGEAEITAPAEPFPHFETTAFTIDGDTRPVLMLHPPAHIRYRVSVPNASTLLVTSVAIDPDTWSWGGDGAVMRIMVQGASGIETLWEQQVVLSSAEQRWHDVVVDMGRFRGQTVVIQFEVDPGPAGDYTGDRTGWAQPVLFGVNNAR